MSDARQPKVVSALPWEPSPELRAVQAAWWRVSLRGGLAFLLCLGVAVAGAWLGGAVSGWFGILFVAGWLGAFIVVGVGLIWGLRLKWREFRLRRFERAAWRAGSGGRHDS